MTKYTLHKVKRSVESPPMCTVVISVFTVASSWSVIVLWVLVTCSNCVCNYDAKKWQVCVD